MVKTTVMDVNVTWNPQQIVPAFYPNQNLYYWPQEGEKLKVQSKIRVTLSRNLTYSEREVLRDDWSIEDSLKFRFSEPNIVWLEDFASTDSRQLYEFVADYVEHNFVNVHPVAVRTFIPEVKV